MGDGAWDESAVTRFFREARTAEAAREIARLDRERREKLARALRKNGEDDDGEDEEEPDEPWKDRGGWYHDADAEQRQNFGDNTAADGKGRGG